MGYNADPCRFEKKVPELKCKTEANDLNGTNGYF